MHHSKTPKFVLKRPTFQLNVPLKAAVWKCMPLYLMTI